MILSVVLTASFVLTGQTAACPARASWPSPDWSSRAEQVAVAKKAEIEELERFAFTLTGADEERLGARTNSVLVLSGGQIVYERYARGWKPELRHIQWSVTKSVVSALAGRAVERGLLAIDRSICTYLPSTPERHCRITVKDLLELGSGLDWAEVYENQSNQASSVLAMLYGQGRQDMAAFVLSHEPFATPGTEMRYSSGDATLLAGLVGAAVASLGEDWPWTLLFDPIGARSAVFERDASGTYVGSSHLYLTPRDMARVGYLYLNDGCWDGARLLPAGWVTASTSVSSVLMNTKLPADDPRDVQGRWWWLNRDVPSVGRIKAWPDAPEDTFMAIGHWGQTITVIPSLDLVIVRTADDRAKDVFDSNAFLVRAIAVGRGS